MPRATDPGHRLVRSFGGFQVVGVAGPLHCHLGRCQRQCSVPAIKRCYRLRPATRWRIRVFGRKSFATTAAGLLAVVALVAVCSSTPLTDPHKILTNAKANFDVLNSVHFHFEAGGQFIFGSPAATPTPTIEPTPVPTIEPSASAAASGSAPVASGSTAVSGSPPPRGPGPPNHPAPP